MHRPDFLQKVVCGLAGIQRGKFVFQFQQRRRRRGRPEGLLSPWRCGHAWPEDGQTRPGGPKQDQGIVEVVAGEHVVAGPAQQFSQVSEHIRRMIDTQYGGASERWPRRCCLPPIKGQHGVFLGGVGVKQGDQGGHLQDFVYGLGQIAQFQIAAGAADAGQQPHQHSQSAAVDENYLAQVQNDVAAIRQQFANLFAQQLGFTAGHNAAAATDDGDIPDCARVQ